MNPIDSDYRAFLDRLPELRRLYDRRLHQFELTRPGHGDSLGNVVRYFERVRTVREGNRQTLRRLVAFVDKMHSGMAREMAIDHAWRAFPDPGRGMPSWVVRDGSTAEDVAGETGRPETSSTIGCSESTTRDLDSMVAGMVGQTAALLLVIFLVGLWCIAPLYLLFVEDSVVMQAVGFVWLGSVTLIVIRYARGRL